MLDARDAVDLPRLRCESPPLPGEPDVRVAEAIRVARSFPSRGLALPREIALGKEADPEGLVLRLTGMEARFVMGVKDLDAASDVGRVLAKRPAESPRRSRWTCASWVRRSCRGSPTRRGRHRAETSRHGAGGVAPTETGPLG